MKIHFYFIAVFTKLKSLKHEKTLDQLGSQAVKDQCKSEQTDDVNVAFSCVSGKKTVQSNLGRILTIENSIEENL